MSKTFFIYAIVAALNVYYIQDANTETLYVSQGKGNNTPGCGYTEHSMCGSLIYALYWRQKEQNLSTLADLTILLDRGTYEIFIIPQFRFVFNGVLSVKKLPYAKWYPYIISNEWSRDEVPSFVYFSFLPRIYFQSIIFSDINVVTFGEKLSTSNKNITNGFITMRDCWIYRSYDYSNFQYFMRPLANTTRHKLTITLEDVKIWSGVTFLASTTFPILSMTIKNSIIGTLVNLTGNGDEGSVHIEGSNLKSLAITNFSSVFLSIDHKKNYLNIGTIKLKLCYVGRVGRLHLKDTLFTDARVSIQNIDELIMKNQIFNRTHLPLTNISNAVISESIFQEADTSEYGGAIKLYNIANLTISSCNFNRNYACRSGGGIYVQNTNLSIVRSTFTENYSYSAGTFYFGYNSNVALLDCIIDGVPLNQPFYYNTILESVSPITLINITIVVHNSNDGIDVSSAIDLSSSNVIFKCPPSSNVKIITENDWGCKFCEKGQYTLYGGNADLPSNDFKNVECQNCPLGGNCQEGHVVSRPNFWGYADKSELKFYPCPEGYCCDNKITKCDSISTCSTNRKGKLCGTCIPNHYVDFFSNKCISNCNYNSIYFFWLGFICFGLACFLLIGHGSDFMKAVKRGCVGIICRTRQQSALRENLLVGNEANSQTDNAQSESTATVFGVVKILINFYQLNQFIHVAVGTDTNFFGSFKDLTHVLFTWKVFIKRFSSSFCPMEGTDIITKTFVTEIGFSSYIVLIAVIVHIYGCCCGRSRCKVIIVQVLVISYTNICTFTLQMVHCIKIDGDNYYLFLNGEIQCLQSWQYPMIVFLVIWVIPFSGALYIVTRLLQKNLLAADEFLFCVIFPPASIVYYLMRSSQSTSNTRSESESNSAPVSVEEQVKYILSFLEDSFSSGTLWDPVMLFRRFIVTVLVVFLTNKVVRLCFLCPVFLLYLYHHSRVMPYSSPLLNHLESFYLFNLSFLTSINIMRAFLYFYSLPLLFPLGILCKIFDIYENVLLSLPAFGVILLPVVFGIRKCFNKLAVTN